MHVASFACALPYDGSMNPLCALQQTYKHCRFYSLRSVTPAKRKSTCLCYEPEFKRNKKGFIFVNTCSNMTTHCGIRQVQLIHHRQEKVVISCCTLDRGGRWSVCPPHFLSTIPGSTALIIHDLAAMERGIWVRTQRQEKRTMRCETGGVAQPIWHVFISYKVGPNTLPLGSIKPRNRQKLTCCNFSLAEF